MIGDNVWVAVIISVPTLITSIASLIASLRNNKKLDVLHDAVNGKMEKLLVVTGAAGFDRGVLTEKKTQEDKKS